VLVLTGLFAWAGALKLRRPSSAAIAIANFRLARRPRVALGRLLGAAELLTAVALALPWSRRGGTVGAGLLSLGFLVVVATALRRGDKFNCGCLGDTDDQIGWHTLGRAGLMLAAACVAFLTVPAQPDIQTWSQSVVLASVIVAAAVLARTWHTLASSRAKLDRALNWEWILQQSYPSIERRPAEQPRGEP
jgi:hypothetical protein